MDFLDNTNIVVTIGFLIFVGVLIYAKVPRLIGSKLDQRAASIRADLAEARALREEAQTMLASYERRQREVAAQAGEIVVAARRESEQAAEKAKADIRASMERRLAKATEQIEAAEQAAIRQVRDRAVVVAVAAAGDVIRNSMKASDVKQTIDASIREVGAKLH
jgi:F-type H+-transporting ATPase subunit b